MIDEDPRKPGKVASIPNPGCLASREMPAVFLRLHSPQEQIALPYASLHKISLKTDKTVLELSFVSHRVTITGKSLVKIYKTETAAEARMIRVVARDFAAEATLRSYHGLMRGIRIEPLDSEERRRRWTGQRGRERSAGSAANHRPRRPPARDRPSRRSGWREAQRANGPVQPSQPERRRHGRAQFHTSTGHPAQIRFGIV